jgi:hypothetical protein
MDFFFTRPFTLEPMAAKVVVLVALLLDQLWNSLFFTTPRK